MRGSQFEKLIIHVEHRLKAISVSLPVSMKGPYTSPHIHTYYSNTTAVLLYTLSIRYSVVGRYLKIWPKEYPARSIYLLDTTN